MLVLDFPYVAGYCCISLASRHESTACDRAKGDQLSVKQHIDRGPFDALDPI